MFITKKIVCISIILSSMCHANTEIIFRFLDMAGLYKIRMESVKDVDLNRKTCTCISGVEKQYMQGHEQFFHLINLSDDADYLLVDIRKFEQPDINKTGTFASGTYKLYNADMLRQYAQSFKHVAGKRLGLSLFNYFNRDVACTQELTCDSLHSLER